MLCVGSSFQSLRASHVTGSDIEYIQLDTGIYQVRISIVWDCNGILLDPDSFLVTANGVELVYYFDTSNRISRKDITGIPPHCLYQSRCAGSSFQYGFEEHVFLDTIDLRAYSQCEWEISWGQCCRNGNITTGSANQNFYNSAMLNKCVMNSSPQFSTTPRIIIFYNHDMRISFRANDPDHKGDSLSYHLVAALQDSGQAVTYSGNWTPIRPLSFFGFPNYNLGLPAGFHLDPVTGQMSFRPTQINQVSVVCVEVRKWRKINGVDSLIGKIRRDIQMFTINYPNNFIPTIDSLPSEYEICIKDTFCFTMTTYDWDSMDSTYIYYYGDIPDAQFTTTNGSEKHARGTFCWAPIRAEISSKPYIFSVNVWDDVCSLAGQTEMTFSIYVRDSVDGVNVDAGPDIIDSTGLDSFYVEGSLMDYSGQALLWTTSGDGVFRFEDSLGTYYIPGSLDKKNCLYELYLEAIDSTPCLGNSKLKDTLLVEQQISDFDAGPDRLVFPGDTFSIQVNADTGRAWNYQWSTSGDAWIEDSLFLFSRFAAGNSDLLFCHFYLILQANSCDTLYDTVWVERDFLPMDAGVDIFTLNTDSIALQAIPSVAYQQHGYWRSTGSGSFSDSLDPKAIYFMDSNDWSACLLQFIWEEIPASFCRINADTIEVRTVFTGLNAGPDQQLDLDDTVFLAASPRVGKGPFGEWKTLGTGSFEDVSDPDSWYLPSASDKSSCRVILLWTYPYPTCSQEQDSLIIRFNYVYPNAGADQQILFGDTLYLNGNMHGPGAAPFYWTSTGDGTFSDSLDPQAQYFPGPQDWINCGSQLIRNLPYVLCGGQNDTLIWTRIPFVLNAGTDIRVYETDSVKLAADLIENGRISGWWSTKGTGTFSDNSDPQGYYYPDLTEQQNCSGRLYWNAPYSTCTPERDSVDWKRLVVAIDAGPDQSLPIGSTITLQGKSSAKRVVWETNGFGRFLDSSSKSTLYYPDSLDFPLCNLRFYLKEIEQLCELQSDSLKVDWKEEGISIKGLNYEACSMDSIEIVLEGNSKLSFNWESNGSGNFYYDSLFRRWIYLPSDADFLTDQIKIKVTATGYCFQELDSIFVLISNRDRWNMQAHSNGPIIAYPNPSRDWVTIDGDCPVHVVNAMLYDMLGREIQHWHIQELPFVLSMEALASGVYLLRVELENGRVELIPLTKYAH
ncbi:MAG TPA: hypothetical protein DIW47_00965 [Bacteroidetes bacterium]|nr:hypothetical protein [Bacteroidota bacterium]